MSNKLITSIYVKTGADNSRLTKIVEWVSNRFAEKYFEAADNTYKDITYADIENFNIWCGHYRGNDCGILVPYFTEPINVIINGYTPDTKFRIEWTKRE